MVAMIIRTRTDRLCHSEDPNKYLELTYSPVFRRVCQISSNNAAQL
jgi:hypothetical protein